MLEIEQLAGLDSQSTPESICSTVAQVFGVRPTETALLEVSGNLLKFLYPAELKNVGAIPLSSSAVAARTARTKRSELFNTFARVKHSSVFEVVKIGEPGKSTEAIQKLMSAPILSTDGKVIGVIQVSRKAEQASAAGADFTSEELRKLEAAAVSIARFLNPDKK